MYPAKFDTEIAEAVDKCVKHIHEDIYEHSPRGQIAPGQEVTWKRCKWLLEFKDKISDILDRLEQIEGQ